MKRLLRRLQCFLRGGHLYLVSNLTHFNDMQDEDFTGSCGHCGATKTEKGSYWRQVWADRDDDAEGEGR